MTKSISPGALRAAERLASARYVETYAKIIDESTGLSELLEALRGLVEGYSSIPDREIGCHLAHKYDQAKEIMAKFGGTI